MFAFGIKLCEENDEIIPFIRKKMELYTYLVDVYYFTDNKEKYSETIKTIKRQMRNIRILAYLLILKSYKNK